MISNTGIGFRVLIAGMALLGVVSMAALWWPSRGKILSGVNDFVSIYTGARLAGSKDLYDPERTREVQIEVSGASGERLLFVRPPFYPVLLWPIGRLPYKVAYAVWQTLSIAAVLAFICLWPNLKPAWVILACCWSFPLSASFANGQDCAFLLLVVALFLQAYKQWPLLAGALLSLCAAKFHLFLLMPLFLALRHRRRILAGLAAGGLLLLSISFLAGGPNWVRDYYAVISSPTVAPGEDSMPNLHGLLAGTRHALSLELLLDTTVVVAVGLVARRSTFEYGMAAALAGGLLVSYHAYPADAVLLIPSLLIVASRAQSVSLRTLAIILLWPVWYVLSILGGPQGNVLRLGVLLMIYWMAWSRTAVLTKAGDHDQ